MIKYLFRILIFVLFIQLIGGISFAGFSVDGVTDPAKVDGVTEPASVDGVTSDYSTPCESMGASGTYADWYNGEYSGDTDKICVNSGASTSDGTDNGSVINSSSPLSGSYDVKLEQNGDYLEWPVASTTIQNAGTVWFTVKTPAALDVDSRIFEMYGDANNFLTFYMDHLGVGSDIFKGSFEGNGDSTDYMASTVNLSASTTYRVGYTWDYNRGASNEHCIKVDAAGWECENDDLVQWSTNPVDMCLGHHNVGSLDVNAIYQVDNVVLLEGYQTADPYSP